MKEEKREFGTETGHTPKKNYCIFALLTFFILSTALLIYAIVLDPLYYSIIEWSRLP